MRLLLDTHTIIWWLLGDPALSLAAGDAIRHPDSIVHVSAATGWEIAIKVRSGRLPSMAPHIATFVEDVAEEGFHHLAIEARHGLRGGRLKGPHKDPFDRLLAARGLIEGLIVVTRDPKIAAFGCAVLW